MLKLNSSYVLLRQITNKKWYQSGFLGKWYRIVEIGTEAGTMFFSVGDVVYANIRYPDYIETGEFNDGKIERLIIDKYYNLSIKADNAV